MRLSWRKWGVPAASWLAVLALAGMALAGAEGESVTPEATLSPEAVVDGKTLASGEAFEMTLHLTGDPDTEFGLTLLYGGDPVGVCQTDAETLTTNPEGKATFECAFTTVENSGTEDLTGTVTFVVAFGGETVTESVATLTVSSAAEEEPEEPEETEGPEVAAEDGVNHGHCVSYWAHQAKAEGLQGRAKGAFVSAIAQDEEAVSSKVADGGEPDETCDFAEQLAAALVAQEAEALGDNETRGNGNGKGKGKDLDGEDAAEEGSDDA